MRRIRPTLYAAIAVALGLWPALPTAARAEALQTINDRRSWIIEREEATPFPKPGTGSAETQTLAEMNLALAELWLGTDKYRQAANDRLGRVLASIRRQPYYKGVSPQHVAGTPPDNDYFHFQLAQYLFRIDRMFGREGSRAPATLSEENAAQIRAVLYDWARTECRVADTDSDRIWVLWGSENHDALRDGACWAAAALVAGDASLRREHYADGSTATLQLAGWTAFIKLYLRERGRSGALIEYFSPTYAQYTLLNVYMYADFSADLELRKLAKTYLDLWWALWAQEQLDGVHGGSKTRSYAATIADGTSLPTSAWLYFGIGTRPTTLPPGEASMVVSDYRPPALVAELATQDAARGTYDVLTRAPGLASEPRGPGFVYHVDPGKNGVLRVTHVTPGFALGMGMVPLLPDRAWTEISSQNRWAGLVFSGGNRRLRIVPSILLPPGEKSYNALFGVQSAATQLVRGVFPTNFQEPHKMGVWLGRPLRRVEQGEWIFVEASAYAAVRPAFGGWQPDSDNPNWMILNDSRSPVIIQAADKGEYPNLSAYISAVLAMSITVSPTLVSVTGLGKAGILTLGLDDDGTMLIDNRPVEIQPPFVLRSPFVNQEQGSDHVIVKRNDEVLELNFGETGR